MKTLTLLLLTLTTAFHAGAADKPNFVWILSEDNSTHYLRLYGNPLGITPVIEKIASEGIVFDHAFSCAPVCSVARTTLMTGLLAPRVAFQYHRKSKPAHLPPGLKMWPAYLREAGYYTSNNSKKDYNVVEGDGVWDESSRQASWRKRPAADTPFFHMQTTAVSHESSLHFTEAQMRAEQTQTPTGQVQLPPYHPDTPTFRYTTARYHDRMRLVDREVGKVIRQLRDDGLLEDTFIFYFGDHGGVLPRSKGYLYETGLHTPLVVRIPKNFKHLVQFRPGSRAQGFVSFIDFGPTLLHLAGVPVPADLDGIPFLGPEISAANLNARQETFAYADRFDEKYDLCRSLRVGRYKYIRNYQPFYPDGLQNNYRYKMLAYQQWRTLFIEGKLNPTQTAFFLPRPPETLYDIESDPYETRNLASDPAHAKTLDELRARLRDRVKNLPDLSFYPESHMVDHALADPVAFGRTHATEIARLVDIADLALYPFDDVQDTIKDALLSDNDWAQYWGLIVCSSFGQTAAALAPVARSLLSKAHPLVRVRAAEFLGILGTDDPRPALHDVINNTASADEALIALNTVVFLQDRQPGLAFDPDKFNLDKLKDRSQVDRRILYLEGKN